MTKILVGMSGGVDSTAAALMLIKQGYQVEGATLPICGGSSISVAKNICHNIGIKHHQVSVGNSFNKEVISYFKDQIIRGQTPNACVICNQKVKFLSLYIYAMENGFEFISTGHYAKIVNFAGSKTVAKGDDVSKDQSYMLARVDKKVLERLILPLGNSTRKEAEKITEGLYTTPPSQDACFALGDIKAYIKNEVGLGLPGPIIGPLGSTIGKHEGLNAFTIGQREGLMLSDGPWYVVKKDVETNILFVGKRKDVMKSEFNISDLVLHAQKDLTVSIRYRAWPVCCDIMKLETGHETYKVESFESVFAPTPGQFAVFYKGVYLVGSAVIV